MQVRARYSKSKWRVFLSCCPNSFPGATNETLLQKFNSVNKDNEYYEVPQKREAAFIVRHYAGKVKYQSVRRTWT